MKLFGGKPKKQKAIYADNNKPQKKPGSRKSRKRLILMFAIFAAVLISAIAIKSVIKPPSARNESDPSGLNEESGQGLELTVEDMGERKEDFFTMVIACTDEDKTRTDAIIVAAFDVKNKSMNMVSIPRDTYSKVNRNLKKINSAYAIGKEEQMIKELNLLLGIPIDRYAVFDFDGVSEMVEAIGGVEYEVPFRMKYTDPTQDLYIDLQAGLQKLNGEKAVHFLRWRENDPGIKGGYAEGDIGRIKAQQAFLMTLAKRMLVPSNILKVPEIAAALLNNTKTDFTKGELVWLGLAAVQLNSDNLTMQTLPGFSETIYEPGVGMNQSYYFPNKDEVLTLVNEKFNPYLKPITDITVVDISALSGSSSGKKSSSGSSTKQTESGKTQTETPEKETEEQPPKEEEKPETESGSETETPEEQPPVQSSDDLPFDDSLRSQTVQPD